MDKKLAKSLHTVTVLVRVAKLHMAQRRLSADDMGSANAAHAYAVNQALETLGLSDMIDVDGLAGQAIRQLNKYS